MAKVQFFSVGGRLFPRQKDDEPIMGRDPVHDIPGWFYETNLDACEEFIRRAKTEDQAVEDMVILTGWDDYVVKVWVQRVRDEMRTKGQSKSTKNKAEVRLT
jgi:predicted adenine nucleotide alpha hydrolase (AANH) superfamily ATPase